MEESKYTGEFIISEANGTRSRETGTLLSGESVVAGELLGKITLSGKYVAYDNTKSDGSQTIAGIAFDNTDATGGDISGIVIIVRDAEVRGSDLIYNTTVSGEITTAKTGLKTLRLIVR